MVARLEFVDKPKEELTTDDLRKMIRVDYLQNIPVKRMLEYYEIDADDYYQFLLSKGLRLTTVERRQLREIREKNKSENDPEYEISKMFKELKKVPDFILYSLYEIDFEYIDGKFYYDQIQLQKARKDSKEKIEKYIELKRESIRGKKKAIEHSDLNTSDLVAMRYYRGISRRKLASKWLVKISEIKAMEQESPVTRETAKRYMKELNIKKHHIKQLRKIMNGKVKEIHDDRQIPKVIKVAVWKRDKGKCTSCGAKDKLHYHHKERFADGGQNTIGNLTLLCASCHAEEHKGEKSYHMLKAMAKE